MEPETQIAIRETFAIVYCHLKLVCLCEFVWDSPSVSSIHFILWVCGVKLFYHTIMQIEALEWCQEVICEPKDQG